ncbi:hypothetical protein [Pseudomonas sp. KNUC1026]|uniref:hypothetical protein n=1 Tax=Pseudomonas sp. KNUC1026 TaxID=2893890 RepID=UPI001F41AA0C|nr:hypothetical protein [Pseudomonas sp. KNUC1026]UFH51582.1 hypothetical protein LN139_11895 [Pseudomonas sp. KNUC1026]
MAHGPSAIARALEVPVTLFGSRKPDGVLPSNVRWVELPLDYVEGVSEPGLRQPALRPCRAYAASTSASATLAQWFEQHWPCLLVVDVSVEVALLARLCSVPTIYLRQHGERSDSAHRLAYDTAQGLLAPYPQAMAAAGDPWAGKTFHSGWLSRYNGRVVREAEPGTVLLISGHGGSGLSAGYARAVARQCPAWQVRVAGPTSMGEGSANLQWLGVLADPADEMQRAEIVVGSASDSLVSEAAALGCRYVAVGEQRPFDEQSDQARRLDAWGAALGLEEGWPAAERWPALLEQARALDGLAWQQGAPPEAARRAARWLQAQLAQVQPPS